MPPCVPPPASIVAFKQQLIGSLSNPNGSLKDAALAFLKTLLDFSINSSGRNSASRPCGSSSDCIFVRGGAALLLVSALRLFLRRLQDVSYMCRLFAAGPGASIQTAGR